MLVVPVRSGTGKQGSPCIALLQVKAPSSRLAPHAHNPLEPTPIGAPPLTVTNKQFAASVSELDALVIPAPVESEEQVLSEDAGAVTPASE